jgi:hypothetical protein
MPLYISEKREVISKDELSETKKDKVKKKEKKEKLFIVGKKENKTKTGKK